MHINSSLPNLIGGVSQQPELVRLPSHLKAQDNSTSSPSKGLSKRPPSVHLGTLAGFGGSGFYETLDYGPRGVFNLFIDPAGNIRITDETGTPKTVFDASDNPITSSAYLASTNPDSSIRAVKEADTTFLLNTSMVAAQSLVQGAYSTWPALVWVKAGNYSRTYTVTVPGYGTAAYSTPDGSSAAHLADTRTDVIAASLGSQLSSMGVPGVSVSGSIIGIGSPISGTTTEDGMGGNTIAYVHRSVSSFAELPSRRAPSGFFVKVEGGDATGAGDYYVRFNSSTGVYEEFANPAEAHYAPSAATMPLTLVPFSTGFKLAPMAWKERRAGDGLTNPQPTFIGRTINDLFFYQDRLGFLSGDGYDISEVGEYSNFYRTTAVDLLDSDPVSGTVPHPKVSTLRHAVPFNKRLLAFSDKAQFEITGGDYLTPKSVTARLLTEFECSSVVRPTGIGASLYFPADRGDYSSFFNFFVSGSDSLEEAVDVSGHVPEYIPKNVTAMVVSPVNNLVAAHSKSEPSHLYVYQFYNNGPERLQSAWHRWLFENEATIRSAEVVGTSLYLMVERPVGAGVVVSAEKIELSASPYSTRLDRRCTILPGAITVTANGAVRTSTMTIPYAAGSGQFYAVVTGAGNLPVGTVLKLTSSHDSPTLTAIGDLTGCTVEVGVQYRQKATLGRLMVREGAGGGVAGVSRGRTQVGRVWVNYTSARTFSIEVAVEGRDPVVYKETGRRLGTETARIGELPLTDGRFGCPVLSENTRVEVSIINDGPFPSSFLSVDWEGFHVSRGRHV